MAFAPRLLPVLWLAEVNGTQTVCDYGVIYCRTPLDIDCGGVTEISLEHAMFIALYSPDPAFNNNINCHVYTLRKMCSKRALRLSQ